MTNFFDHIKEFELNVEKNLAGNDDFQSRMIGLLGPLFKQFPNLVSARWYVEVKYNDHINTAFPSVSFAYSYTDKNQTIIDKSPWLSLYGIHDEGLDKERCGIMQLINVGILEKLERDYMSNKNYEFYKKEYPDEFANDPQAFKENYLLNENPPGLWQDELMRYYDNHLRDDDEEPKLEPLSVEEFLREHPKLEQSNALAIMANLTSIISIVIPMEYDHFGMGFAGEDVAWDKLSATNVRNGRATRKGVFFEAPW